MRNPDADVLFPARILSAMCDLRDTPWQELVSTVIAAGPDSIEQIGFILMMARMNNCATCSSDSYRAMNGCTVCAKQSLHHIHESDQTLIEIYNRTRREVENYLHQKIPSYQSDPLDRSNIMKR